MFSRFGKRFFKEYYSVSCGQAAFVDFDGLAVPGGIGVFHGDGFGSDGLEQVILFGGIRRQGEGGVFLDLEFLAAQSERLEREDGGAVVLHEVRSCALSESGEGIS